MEMLRKYILLLLCFLSFGLIGCDSESEGRDSEEDVLVSKVVLDQTSVELKEGAVLTLTATVTPKNATNKDLKWTSDNEAVVTVQNGKVTAVAAGYATITVIATDGSKKSAICEVVVIERQAGEVLVEKISLNKSSVSLKVGETAQLSATVTPEDATDASLNWVSTDQEVAFVSRDGKVTAVGAGSAVVKAVANDGSGVEASCQVTVTSENGGNNGGGDSKAMSPMEAKNKMESAGITFANAIKADTHQNLVDVVAFLDEDLAYYDIDEDYYEKLEALIQETGYEDYSRKVNPVKSMVGLTKLCVDAAQKGAQLSTRAADVYTLTLKAGLKDLYGKFTPDSYNEEWKYESASDRLEVAFTDDKGQKWVATLKGSSATTRVKLAISDKGTDHSYYVNGPSAGSTSYNSEWNDQYNISIDVPKEITFVVKCGGTTVIDLKVNSSLAFELDGNMGSEGTHYYYWEDYYGYYYCNGDTYDYTYTFDVNYSNLNLDAKMSVNGYEETFKTDVTKSEISASAGIKIDGKSMLTANATIKANIDAIIDDASEERFKSRNIEKFSMKFDLLGEVQVDAECPNFKNLYDAAVYLDEADDIDAANQWLSEVNNSYTVKLRFDNTSVTQATIEMEAAESDEEWDSYFYVYPVIVFASNASRYSLDEYFTESAFSDLIDTVEDLVEEFEDLYGY